MLATIFDQPGSDFLPDRAVEIGMHLTMCHTKVKAKPEPTLSLQQGISVEQQPVCVADDCICTYCEVLLLQLRSLTDNDLEVYLNIKIVFIDTILLQTLMT